jgi:ribokinase
MKKLCVVGSLNMDLVTYVEDFPKPGETIRGKSYMTFPGGKGANQAVALGKLGADVNMVGKVGDDVYGSKYLEVLKQSNVNSEGVSIQKDISTGIAVIQVTANSENNIVVVAGANGEVDCQFIEKQWSLLREAEIFLFQLEIPIDTVVGTMQKLKENGKIVILDPAPAVKLPDEIYGYIDYITPNETEIKEITGRNITSDEELKEAAGELIGKGVKTVIVKMGKQGARIFCGTESKHVEGFKVKAVDTTAAGDSFNAGFAFALAQNKEVEECVRFANAVGAISTTALGAQAAMPDHSAVINFINEN